MAGNGNIQSHEATYNGVIGLLKWGAVSCFVIVGVVLWLIAG